MINPLSPKRARNVRHHHRGHSAGTSQSNANYAAVRSTRCPILADVDAMYDGCHSVGLQYGPGYRTITHTWASGGDVASARLRARKVRQATQVHPADLDDALCVGALASSGSSDGETRLPFAVDDALLVGVSGQLWAVSHTASSRPDPSFASRILYMH